MTCTCGWTGSAENFPKHFNPATPGAQSHAEQIPTTASKVPTPTPTPAVAPATKPPAATSAAAPRVSGKASQFEPTTVVQAANGGTSPAGNFPPDTVVTAPAGTPLNK